MPRDKKVKGESYVWIQNKKKEKQKKKKKKRHNSIPATLVFFFPHKIVVFVFVLGLTKNSFVRPDLDT